MTQINIPQALMLIQQHFTAGQFQQAEFVCRQILSIQPLQPQALHMMGRLAMQARRADLAVEVLTRSANMQPHEPEVQVDLGNANLTLGRMEQAIAAYQRCLELRPNHASACCNLGIALHEAGRTQEAIAQLYRAVAVDPNRPHPYINLGNALRVAGQFDDAIAVLERAIAIRPDLADAYLNLASALTDCGRVEQAIAACRHALKVAPNSITVHSSLLMHMLYDPASTPQAIYDEHRRWNELYALPFQKQIQPHANDRSPERRLRIGYLSPDMRQHSVAYFLEQLLANHDVAQVEVFCYADLQRRQNEVSQRLEKMAHHWQNITGWPDRQIVDRVRADKIDILVDLAGHTAGGRLLVFACKPAPIQVTYIGYPNTTGLTTIDYRFTDPWCDPPGMTEQWHSEQLFRLPETFLCYSPPPDAPPPSPAPAASTGSVTFGSFNGLPKMNAPLVALWSQILQKVPQSRMLIKATNLDKPTPRQHLLDLFAANGIAADRLDLRSKVPSLAEHLGLYGQVDITLDTFPYHGTATTCEALWMGVPTVVQAGSTHISRVGVSLLTNVGVPELIAQSPEQYVQIAVELANDLPRLTELRTTLREKMRSSPLMDAPHLAKNIEQAYRTMWRKWCGT